MLLTTKLCIISTATLVNPKQNLLTKLFSIKSDTFAIRDSLVKTGETKTHKVCLDQLLALVTLPNIMSKRSQFPEKLWVCKLTE